MIYRTLILLLFCMDVSLDLSHQRRNVSSGCSRIRCWGGHVGLRGKRYQGNGGDWIMWSLRFCKPTSFKWRRRRLAGHVERMGDRRVAYRLVVGKSEFQSPLESPWNRWFDNIEMDLQNVVWRPWTGFIWLRKDTRGGLLWMRERTFWCHKMRRISWLVENRSAPQDELCLIGLLMLVTTKMDDFPKWRKLIRLSKH